MGQFSRDNIDTLIKDYIYLASQLTDRQWDLIVAFYGVVKNTPTLLMHSVQMNH